MIHLYNSLRRRVSPFRARGAVRMYICGPTVYGPPHTGHAKSYVTFDALRRLIESEGFRVLHAQNFTDVAEEITRRAAAERRSVEETAEDYIGRFHSAMDGLGVLRAHSYPRVSRNIDGILRACGELVDAGTAYVAPGGLYFRAAAGDYGSLLGKRVGGAVADAERGGRSPWDFALWELKKEGRTWDSPWGRGGPGWHVECFAMARDHPGLPLDIQGGGVDLQFPHHESCALISRALGIPTFARFFLHNGYITLKGEKMSKSLANTVPLAGLLERWGAGAVRLFLLSTHYRRNADYSAGALRDAARQHRLLARCAARAGTPTDSLPPRGTRAAAAFRAARAALLSDMKTDAALGALLRYAAWSAKGPLSGGEREGAASLFGWSSRVLGLPVADGGMGSDK